MTEHVPAGTIWGGLDRSLNSGDISPECSPDSTNTFYGWGRDYDSTSQVLGVMGPRKGKEYVACSTGWIRGFFNVTALANLRGTGATGHHLLAIDNGVGGTIDLVLDSKYTGNIP